MLPTWLQGTLAALSLTMILLAQQPALPPGFRPAQTPPQPGQQPAPQQPAQRAVPAPGQAAPATANPTPAAPPTQYGGLSLNNASLTEVIDLLARQLKINYILDPRVKGGVILNTYGETKDIDTRSLLETILRINGFGIVKQGELYRIVPLAEISHLPVPIDRVTDSKDIPDDDRTMLNLVFLKYVTADELAKVLGPFLGENAKAYTYPPANLIFLLDSRRNMRRIMELVSLFDSDTLANQRVRLFETHNGEPSEITKDLENIVKGISLNDKTAPIKFLAVNRINTIIAIAPNPGAFAEVEKWIKKLDVPMKITSGSVDNYVYRVKYGQAPLVGGAIMMLYTGQSYGYGGMGGYGMGMGMGMGGMGGSFGNNAFGNSALGTFGNGGYGGGMGGYGGAGYGNYGGGYGGGYGGYGGGGYGGGYGAGGGFTNPGPGTTGGVVGSTPIPGQPGGTDLTGSYLGANRGGLPQILPRIIPNPLDNTLLIQATPQQYEGILKLLKQLDVPPRQVLIDAHIYEVDLTGAFASGVSAYLNQLNQTTTSNGGTVPTTGTNKLLGNLASGVVQLSAGALVGRSRQLLAFMQLQETQQKAKTISAPSIIATDSIPASINVGEEVPTLTSQAVTGVQVAGSSAFANTINNQQTGVTMNILARVNPTGIVTMLLQQNVSAPIPPAAGGIQSPSFSQRTISTQVTVQDGDTIAIGGIISEADTLSTGGIPILERIPFIGGLLFGSKSTSKSRTELIVFLTPRVIYDMNDIVEASDELKGRLKMMRRLVRE